MNNLRRIILILLAVMCFHTDSKAKELVDTSVCNILRQNLPGSISINKESSKYAVEYCPDNTCEIFTGNKKHELCEFVFIYLYKVSDYIYLEDFRKNAVVRDTFDVKYGKLDIDKYSKKLILRSKVKLYFSRDDEGSTVRNKVDIDKLVIK